MASPDRRDDRNQDTPRLTGRFSYCSYAANLYATMFLAYNGSGSIIISRNLTRDEAVELTSKLNETLNDFRREFIEPNYIEFEE